MAIFTISGAIRGDQLVDEILQATGIDMTDRYSYIPPDTITAFGADIDTAQAEIQAIIDTHVPDYSYFAYDLVRQNKQDVIARLNLTNLAGMTPAEIYTIVESRIDGWTSLADAKTDFHEWMPLLFAAIYWLVKQAD